MRPTSPDLLATFLLGAWSLSKTFVYERGGKSGSFIGKASFAPIQGLQGVLAYEEEGTATLMPEAMQLNARHALLYDCRPTESASTVRVLFDEATARESVESRLAGARFFHTIDFAAATLDSPPLQFSHPCGPDMYYGRFLFSEEEFVLDWRVTGPRKSGSAISRFRRAAVD